MDPLSSNDPLHQLLGKARQVQVRPDFTQNVMRAIRQEPQSLSLWEKVQEWLLCFGTPQRACMAGLAALVVTAASLSLLSPQDAGQSAQPSIAFQIPAVPDTALAIQTSAESALPEDEAPSLETVVATDLDNLDQLSILLAQQDISSLTDTEIAVLLY